jgi:hypothetical protein
MLFDTESWLPSTKRGTTAQNAGLESFLIHARGLSEFFSKETDERFKQNMRAVDFVSDGFPVKEEDKIRRIHREIAHLGWERKENGTDGELWQTDEIIGLIASPAHRFLEVVSKREDLMTFDKNRDSCLDMKSRFGKYVTKIEATALPFPTPFEVSKQDRLYSSSVEPTISSVGPVTFRPKPAVPPSGFASSDASSAREGGPSQL